MWFFCPDFNECARDNGGCNLNCTNTDGTFVCSCSDDYKLEDDERTCSGK